MKPDTDLLAQLLGLPDHESQRVFLNQHAQRLDSEETAQKLKEQADQFLRMDIQRALDLAELLGDFGRLTHKPRHQALGLLAEANARYIGLGEYEAAISLYDQAGQIYQNAGYILEQAVAQIGRIGALVNLGRYQEALDVGGWASQILEDSKAWTHLAKLTKNLGIVHYRIGEDQLALDSFEKAQMLYLRSGNGEQGAWPRAETNRAIVLRNLGRFDDSIQASTAAYQALSRLGHDVESARAHQSLALTYYLLGKYNEALAILDTVRTVFLTHGHNRDAILTELFISDCLLQLRRFENVLEKCEQVRLAFTELGTRFEVTQAILNEAVAYAGLARYDSALTSLSEARDNFLAQDSQSWAAYCELEIAEIYLELGDPHQSLKIALACIGAFEGQPAKQAQARLVAAQAALAGQDRRTAYELVHIALEASEELDMPSLGYLCHHVQGQIAEQVGDLPQAMKEYEIAISDLEKLRGRLMVEFRSGFLEDKQRFYEDMVAVCLALDNHAEALAYAERGKSRALLDLLAHRLDLGIHPREDRDRELVDELERLRDERDRLYRRWESSTQEEMRERGWSGYQETRGQVQAEVQNLEKRITGLWHQLLIRNADYARDASLWQVRVEPFQEYLDPNTLLIEYYITRGVVYIFLVTKGSIVAKPLKASVLEIQTLFGLLWLNFRSVPRSDPTRIDQLTTNAQGVLRQFYEALLKPVRPTLNGFQRLIIVPHGLMHYLPFHALYDGQKYLVETHEVSYLPGASFMRYTQDSAGAESGALILGNTYEGYLPNTLSEAAKIAAIWGTPPYLEETATLAALRDNAGDKKLIHLATHGDFRPDNPLFSGLALADGWLTTLDIFNFQLQASLVVLSACETGRSVVGGGDELLGLMRAFLSAGASSLLLSLWAVEDRSTAILMEAFNEALSSAGKTKGAALRAAQLPFVLGSIAGDEALAQAYRHPYFWAPFILVGDSGVF
jgi:CHAT domain-containing protein/Tfp pilus assembly protein PilF